MEEIKESPLRVALIGDLIKSRQHDRALIHSHLLEAITSLPNEAGAVDAVRPTVGDEIQGTYSTLGAALRTAYLIRLYMLSHGSDIRFGIGRGEITTIDEAAGIEDGSAWWSAREAIEHVEEKAQSTGWTGVRSSLSPDTTSINPILNLIDSRISSLKAGACESLRGLLLGEANAATAERQGISASANSQRVNTNDLKPLAEAIRRMWDLS